MEKPGGRYWTGIVGNNPSPDDEEFVQKRTAFVYELPKYNELKEARELRRKLIMNPNPQDVPTGSHITTDLLPEYQAITDCLDTVQKKLKIS